MTMTVALQVSNEDSSTMQRLDHRPTNDNADNIDVGDGGGGGEIIVFVLKFKQRGGDDSLRRGGFLLL